MLFDEGVTKDKKSLSNKSWIGSFVTHYIRNYGGIGYCADQRSAPLDAFPLESSAARASIAIGNTKQKENDA